MANDRKIVMTPEFILSFPNLFEMREYQGKKSYQITMVFPEGTDLTALKAAAKECLDAKFPNGCKNPTNPFGKGDDKVDEWGSIFKGAIYVRASTQFAPKVVDQNRVEILDADKVYAGCYCRALVAPYAYDKAGNRGVSFSLEAVQFLRDGKRIGGGVSIDMFDDGKVAPTKSTGGSDPLGDW
jgi:hypothetical protein